MYFLKAAYALGASSDGFDEDALAAACSAIVFCSILKSEGPAS